eukprot:1156841-Pelagomonas_calceolata.AAC.10
MPPVRSISPVAPGWYGRCGRGFQRSKFWFFGAGSSDQTHLLLCSTASTLFSLSPPFLPSTLVIGCEDTVLAAPLSRPDELILL